MRPRFLFFVKAQNRLWRPIGSRLPAGNPTLTRWAILLAAFGLAVASTTKVTHGAEILEQGRGPELAISSQRQENTF
jgi:hypothetical protein